MVPSQVVRAHLVLAKDIMASHLPVMLWYSFFYPRTTLCGLTLHLVPLFPSLGPLGPARVLANGCGSLDLEVMVRDRIHFVAKLLAQAVPWSPSPCKGGSSFKGVMCVTGSIGYWQH